MAFADDIDSEFNAILSKRNDVGAAGALDMYSAVVKASPVDEGELKASWELPKKIKLNVWRVGNFAPHSIVIDGGRRLIPYKNGMKMGGSEQLPDGYSPVIKRVEKHIQKELDRI